ncbi:hypothetical protein niasHT_005499 [Heterodera trifolii]|uniref:F-box domain-containing protein n=1 Tax=Heterodera trifolii TaxID=157864 RepID=A0ABD2LSS8_9BILA
MSDRRKEAEEKMAKAIFISADCWLCVFDLLSPRKLGLRISMISHRFDYYVDEHFKTRKWTLKYIRIRRKIGENKQMEIVNSNGKPMPIPQIQMPRKVIGFRLINIIYIDQNAIAFLRRFCQFFAACKINLAIVSFSDRILEFILRNIWPMLGEIIHGLQLSVENFHRLRHFTPSILNECPSLRVVSFYGANLFPEFPANDNAMASDGQSVAKWLFTPLQNNVPKELKCDFVRDVRENWPLKIEAFKAAFASASSPANFIVSIWFPWSFVDSVLAFDLTNELTREQLALNRIDKHAFFHLIRCPIARDESKWTKWEKEAIGWNFLDQWNRIEIQIINEHEIGDGLLDATPGPSDEQQQK